MDGGVVTGCRSEVRTARLGCKKRQDERERKSKVVRQSNLMHTVEGKLQRRHLSGGKGGKGVLVLHYKVKVKYTSVTSILKCSASQWPSHIIIYFMTCISIHFNAV